MDNSINQTIVNNVAIKSVAIHKALKTLPPPEFKDLWAEKNSIEHQKNCENKSVSETNDIMKNTKTSVTQNDWKDITDPKLRKKMRLKAERKRYNEKHKDRIKKQRKVYYDVNKDKIRERHKVYRVANKEKLKAYREVNKERVRNYRSTQYHNNPQYKLRVLLRSRLQISLKNTAKVGSAVKDLGCSINELKSYLESKFQPGMTWNNHGQYGWHIDHIKPLASFDLTDRKQLLEACHYTNLQPMWWNDNLSKGRGV